MMQIAFGRDPKRLLKRLIATQSRTKSRSPLQLHIQNAKHPLTLSYKRLFVQTTVLQLPMQLLDFLQSLCNRLQVPAPSRRRTADAYRPIPQNALRQVVICISCSIERHILVQLATNLFSVAHQPGFFD
ncbi:hypothetical protein GIV26_24620 [Pseudomonas sp. PA-1-3F]|nr:hypothetical protein [Pseudomonas sp. PA-1-3F]